MTVVGAGTGCVRWGYPGLLAIVASWFASPVLAGLLSALMLVCIKYGVLRVSGYLSSMEVDLSGFRGGRLLENGSGYTHQNWFKA